MSLEVSCISLHFSDNSSLWLSPNTVYCEIRVVSYVTQGRVQNNPEPSFLDLGKLFDSALFPYHEDKKNSTESIYKPFSCGEEEREFPLIFHSLCVLTACLRSASWFEFWRDMQGPPQSKKASPCDERVAAGARAEVTVGNAHLERDIVLRSSHEQDDFSCRLKSTCALWIYPRPGKSRLPCSPLLISYLQLATKEEEGFLTQAQASLQRV